MLYKKKILYTLFTFQNLLKSLIMSMIQISINLIYILSSFQIRSSETSKCS